MFGKRIHLFTIFGFAIGIDVSWFFLAVLVTWSLATGVFPTWYGDLPALTYWWMGVVGALGLFASIVLHELSHSLVARHHGVIMRGITLFIFGGVAEMTDEPPSPKAEFQVAVAGPLASVLVSMTCLALYLLGGSLGWPYAIGGVLKYLSLINGVLVLFNLIPAFPLDGGRVLRSVLWRWKNDLMWATRVTSQIGIVFSFLLIGLGVLRAVTGDPIGGIWSFLIGLFLRGAANMSYRQLLIRRSLEGLSVRRFMRSNPVTVPAHIPLAAFVDEYVYLYHFKMFPVVDGNNLIGCIATRQLKGLAREAWRNHAVGELTQRCSPENTIDASIPATQALAKMSQTGVSRLMVVEGGRLVGVITLKDLLQFLTLKVDLEGK